MAIARVSSSAPTLAGARISSAAVTALGIIGFALLTAVGAAVRFPVPGTPVPITAQSLAVLLAGFALGPRRGAASQALYLALGMTGLPVFAAASLATAPATGGYLVGFVFAAMAVGVFSRRLPDSVPGIAITAVVGECVVLLCGVAWLAWILGGNVGLAMQQGLVPFLPGAVLKTAAAVGIVRSAGLPRRRLAGIRTND